MPHYFFELRGGDIEADDLEGLELPNDEAAHAKGLVFARDLLAAAVMEGRLALHERIDIRDQMGRMVESISFGQAVGLPE